MKSIRSNIEIWLFNLDLFLNAAIRFTSNTNQQVRKSSVKKTAPDILLSV